MKNSSREILRGLLGGAGFLLGLIFLQMPWWLALAMGAGLYFGCSLLIPAPPVKAEPDWVALGISAADRDQFVANCRRRAADLRNLAEQTGGKPIQAQIVALSETASRLGSYLEKKPESILLANSVPQNLDYLVKLLARYVELAQYPARSASAAEALKNVEETVRRAAAALDEMQQQLLNEDATALKASAQALEFLLGIDREREREQRRREFDTTSPLENLPNGSTRPQPQTKEKPL
jgi:hypothetical protein